MIVQDAMSCSVDEFLMEQGLSSVENSGILTIMYVIRQCIKGKDREW